MFVTTECKGLEITGLSVGAANARRHFSRHIRAIDLRMDDLEIQCELPHDFWQGEAIIRDPRLRDWLTFKLCHELWNRAPTTLAMEQSGVNSFTIYARAFSGFRQSDATVDFVPVPIEEPVFTPRKPVVREAEVGRPVLVAC